MRIIEKNSSENQHQYLIYMERGWYKSQAVCIDGPCLDSGLVFLLDILLMQGQGDLAWMCLDIKQGRVKCLKTDGI